MERLVSVGQLGGISGSVLVRLERPEKANAYNEAMLTSLREILIRVEADQSMRCLIITGAGDRAFCGGADQDELQRRRALHGIDLLSREVFDRLANLPLPTICCINGAAIGGGLELALACDTRVCAPHASFSLPELGMDLAPAAGAMRRLPALVGLSRAKEMIIFGRAIDASTAFLWGITSYCGNDFINQAHRLAGVAVSYDRTAVRLVKACLSTAHTAGDTALEGVTQGLLYELRSQRTPL